MLDRLLLFIVCRYSDIVDQRWGRPTSGHTR